HAEPGEHGRVRQPAVARRAHERSGAARGCARGQLRRGGAAWHSRDLATTMTLWKRILVEKRALIIPLAIPIVANLAVYPLVVYPLGVKAAGAADRAAAASVSVRAAERDFAAAKALVTGKSRAEEELTTFYDKVLPADQAAARRLTYASLPSLAKKSNVRFE